MDELSENLRRAALEFGEVLGSNPIVEKYLDVQRRLEADTETRQLKQQLDEMYGDFIARQAAGGVISANELDAYYALERRVRRQAVLVEQEDRKDEVKDLVSEVHELLSSVLGVNFVEMIEE